MPLCGQINITRDVNIKIRNDPEYEYYVPCKFVVEMEHDTDGWYVANDKVLEFDTSQLN